MRRASFLLLLIVLGSLAVVTAPVRAAGTSYYGVHFSGTGYILLPNTLNLTTYTLIAFVRPSGVPPNYQVLVADSYHQFRFAGDGLNHFQVWINNGSAWVGNLAYYYTREDSHMVAWTYDGSEVSEFVDGNLVGSKAVIQAQNLVFNKLFEAMAGGFNFNGTVYEVLIYNRALSASEIQAIYQDPLNPPTTGLVLWYAPDSVDPSTNTWKDLSGNGNDGSISGATYVPLRPVALQNEAYELSFDGSTSWISLGQNIVNITNNFSVLIFAEVNAPSGQQYQHLIGSNSKSYGFMLVFGDTIGKGKIIFRKWYDENGTLSYQAFSTTTAVSFKEMFLAGVVRSGNNIYLVLNNNIEGPTLLNSQLREPVTWAISALGLGENAPLHGTVYEVLIYARALNSSEIAQLYANPLNPPKDGLVLFYSPYSYDPNSGKWLNIAPIFPTIPLSEELDATNYGAKPVRVSILNISAYDAENYAPIPNYKLFITELAPENRPIFPTLPILPYNQTVTLSIGAVGYYPKIVQLNTANESLFLLLQPAENASAQVKTYDITNSFSSAFGDSLLMGFIVIAAFLVAALKGGLGGAAIMVIFTPLVLAMGFYGYLPKPIAFIITAIAGFFIYYTIRDAIGGGWR